MRDSEKWSNEETRLAYTILSNDRRLYGRMSCLPDTDLAHGIRNLFKGHFESLEADPKVRSFAWHGVKKINWEEIANLIKQIRRN